MSLNTLTSHRELPEANKKEFKFAAVWARFVGICFLAWAFILMLSIILLILNYDTILAKIDTFSGASEEVMEALKMGGKFIFSFVFGIASFIMFLNGNFLYKYGKTALQFSSNADKLQLLTEAMKQLKYYFLLTLIMSLISLFFSTIATFSFL